MTERERELLLRLVWAHAPAATSGVFDALDMSLDLRGDLGFDQIALAELAVAIEDAFGTEIAAIDLDQCRTLGDLAKLAATSA